MYPHYCLRPTGTALNVIADFLGAHRGAISVDIVEHWHDCGGYIALLRTRIEQAMAQVDPAVRAQSLFSAIRFPKAFAQR